MKLKEITERSERWSTPLGTMDAHAPVEDGVLVDLSLWGTSITSIIGLTVECPDGRYFGSLRAPGPVYDQVLEFLRHKTAGANSGKLWTPKLTSATWSSSDPWQSVLFPYIRI